jgi:hypothetical protein
MRRSTKSVDSLTSRKSVDSLSSLTSRGSKSNSNISNSNISNIEDDIIRISNDYYYYSNVFNNKINNIVDRYEGRTNKLYVNYMNRENDLIRLNAKIECITKDLQECKNICIANNKNEQHIVDNTYKYDIRDYIDKIENLCKYILLFLYIYTIWVIYMIINFHLKGTMLL